RRRLPGEGAAGAHIRRLQQFAPGPAQAPGGSIGLARARRLRGSPQRPCLREDGERARSPCAGAQTSTCGAVPMPELALPAGASVRLTATARADRDLHRWKVSVLPAVGGPARLTFGSWIGGRDLHQRIDIPAQDVDCRLEIQSRHQNAQGWANDRASPEEDTPDRLLIGFCNPSNPGARPDDVLL